MSTIDINTLRQQLREIGEEHVLHFLEQLDAQQRQNLLGQITAIDLERVPGWVEEFVHHRPENPLPEYIDPPQWYPADGDDKMHPYDQSHYRTVGEDLIRAGKIAAFCVAGGQGTRLGWNGPKGTFPATPVTRKPLFQLFSEYVLAVKRRYGSVVPFYIMTSPLNHKDTVTCFETHNFFGLDPANIMFLSQGVMPSFDLKTGRLFLTDKAHIAMNPDGHGGSLKALYESGALADMKKRGIEHISYFQVDNPLVKVIDPLFVGLHAAAPDSSGEMSSKMVTKAGPRERVGNFCRVDGRTQIIEYSDLPDELADRRGDNGKYAFRAGSIAIHMIGVDFVEKLNTAEGGFALPLHRAEKKVPHLNMSTGAIIEPTEPNAVKLETFVFEALPLCESSIILETRREDEFAPIKNASGVDSAESSRSLQVELAARWLKQAGVLLPRDSDGTINATVEISPLTALEPADMETVKGLPKYIKGGADVAF